MAIPTVLIIKDGKEVKRLVGLRPESEYTNQLDDLMRIIIGCIIAAALLAGCENRCMRTAGYWHAPGKTFDQALLDYRQVQYDVRKAAMALHPEGPFKFGVPSAIHAGMLARGYEWYRPESLPAGLHLQQVPLSFG